jgi:outer membrane protein
MNGLSRVFLVLTTLTAFCSTLETHAALPDTKIYGLSDLNRTTVSESDVVRARVEERTLAEELKSRGNGAFLPTVYGVASYYRNDAITPAGAATSLSATDQRTVKLVGKTFLFAGGSEYAYLSRAKRLVEASEAEIENSRLGYFVELATAYYTTLLHYAQLTHAKTELQLYDEQTGELRSRVRIGRTRSSDLLSVQAARAGSEARLRSAENAYRESRLALANLARIPPEFELREENVAQSNLGTLEEYLKASEQRPDLVAARKRREAAEKQIAFQRGSHFPTVDVSGNYYLKREGFNANSKWDATLSLTLPIFNGGNTQSLVREAASTYKLSEITTNQLERTAQTEIRSLHGTLQTSEAEVQLFAEAVNLATKSYNQIRRDYRNGLVTNLDLLNSLQTLTNAKRSYDQARYQHLLERARLEAGAGRLPLLGAQ